VRFAAIILALLAMILGPISGPTAARAMNGGAASTVATTGTDCGHGPHVETVKPDMDHGHCKDGGGACMDAKGCRHGGCLTGVPVPGATVDMSPAAAPAMLVADADRPDGREVAPPLDPPRLPA